MGPQITHDVVWRLKHLLHNCIAHPLLPLAEILDESRFYRLADVIFKFHDITTPDGDNYNKQRYL
jgi:hypothetical protein